MASVAQYYDVITGSPYTTENTQHNPSFSASTRNQRFRENLVNYWTIYLVDKTTPLLSMSPMFYTIARRTFNWALLKKIKISLSKHPNLVHVYACMRSYLMKAKEIT